MSFENRRNCTIYACGYPGCTSKFSKPCRLDRHLRTHTGERPYVCHNCNKSYTRLDHLNRHEKIEHSKSSENQEDEYLCEINQCGKRFKYPDSLKKHQQIYHENRLYKCVTCNKTFKKHQQLKIHEYEHTGVKPFVCDHEGCNKAFSLPSKLRAHQKCHYGYRCDVPGCDLFFPKWGLLRKHKKISHRLVYPCTKCDKKFFAKHNLKSHSAVHTIDSDVFPCYYENCPRYYYHERNLMHHIKSYHEKLQYVCTHDGCTFSFKHKVSLDKHLKAHESNAPLRPRSKKKKRRKRKKRTLASELSGYEPASEDEVANSLVNDISNDPLCGKTMNNGGIFDYSAVKCENQKLLMSNTETSEKAITFTPIIVRVSAH